MNIHRLIALVSLFIFTILLIPSCGDNNAKDSPRRIDRSRNTMYKPSKRRRERGYKRYKKQRKSKRPVGTKSFSKDAEISAGTKGFSEEDEIAAAGNNDSYKVDSRQSQNSEQYGKYLENPRTNPRKEPVSTFSIDVDTGSYTNTRRFLTRQKRLPPSDSIRVEEFINYFTYQYPIPKGKTPFSIHHELAPSPFDSKRYLLHIGLQGKKVPYSKRPSSNLVFLLDVSGSMDSSYKLGLLKEALILLTETLSQKDKITIVVYAGAAGLVLPPTNGSNKDRIKDALERLSAGGSTAGSRGIQLAYQMAEKAFIQGGINRVILATDGDFNVGITSHSQLIKLIEQKRKSGIALTVLGFGMYNLNDRTMEQLANKGNGNYFYIDTLNEARKVLVTESASTLQTIAKDVKIQVEFNPRYVKSYRLLGYENRKLRRKDFDDDTIDAGEIGAGHTVTAIYELTLTDRAVPGRSRNRRFNGEIAFFRLRYKKPDGSRSRLIEKSLLKSHILTDQPSDDFLFSSAVAYFAQRLRKSKYNQNVSYNRILKVMKQSRGQDKFSYRKECESLVSKAIQYSRPR